jgi:ribosomal-protein-alanine N-acetyltransferase
VRPARDGDVPAIAAIEQASFADPWPASAFVRLLDAAHARLVVAAGRDDTPVGYCVLLRAADEGEIANIAVAPGHRGSGLGGALLDDALAAADAGGTQWLFLEVRESNAAARRLYGSRGFVEVGRRRGYYAHPREDALVMRRKAPG